MSCVRFSVWVLSCDGLIPYARSPVVYVKKITKLKKKKNKKTGLNKGL
jgi:hypothetical protein